MTYQSQKKAHQSQKKAPKPAPFNGRARTVLRFVLLAFLVTAVVALLVHEVRGRTTKTPGTPTTVSTPSTPSPSDSGVIPTTVDTGVSANGVVAYYFHTTARCTSCLTIEKWTAEAIQTAFAT